MLSEEEEKEKRTLRFQNMESVNPEEAAQRLGDMVERAQKLRAPLIQMRKKLVATLMDRLATGADQVTSRLGSRSTERQSDQNPGAHQQETAPCPLCNTQIPVSSRFCPECGARLFEQQTERDPYQTYYNSKQGGSSRKRMPRGQILEK